MTEAPADYKTTGLFMLIAGIMNLVQGVSMTFLWMYIGIFTCGIGCIGIVLPIGGIVVGVMELQAGIKAQRGEIVPNLKQTSMYGLIASILNCGIIPLIFEALATSNLGKPEIMDWMEKATPIDA